MPAAVSARPALLAHSLIVALAAEDAVSVSGWSYVQLEVCRGVGIRGGHRVNADCGRKVRRQVRDLWPGRFSFGPGTCGSGLGRWRVVVGRRRRVLLDQPRHDNVRKPLCLLLHLIPQVFDLFLHIESGWVLTLASLRKICSFFFYFIMPRARLNELDRDDEKLNNPYRKIWLFSQHVLTHWALMAHPDWGNANIARKRRLTFIRKENQSYLPPSGISVVLQLVGGSAGQIWKRPLRHAYMVPHFISKAPN